MASPALRLQILAAGAGTFPGLIEGRHFEPRCLDNFSKRRAAFALRQPVRYFSDGSAMTLIGAITVPSSIPELIKE